VLTPRLLPLRARHRIAAVLALVFAAGVLAAGPAGAAALDDTDGISIAPANSEGADSRASFDYQAEPGQRLDDLLVVRNTGSTRQSITVFATDAFNTDDGGYGLLDTTVEPTDVGTWVRFKGGDSKVELTLKPGASRVLQFSVDVPANAAPGDHPGGLVLSSLSPDGQIVVDRRVATRLYVRVPGDLQPNINVSQISAEYVPSLNPLSGSVEVTFTVENTGNVALGGGLVVGAHTYFGVGAGATQQVSLAELLPGNERTLTMTIPSIGQIGYLSPFVRVVPSVSSAALYPGVLREVSRDTFAFAVPWWLIILAAIALVFFIVLRIRRRSDARNAAAWMEYTEAEARRMADGPRDREPAVVGSGTGGGADRPAG
jgi:hypothetical protein